MFKYLDNLVPLTWEQVLTWWDPGQTSLQKEAKKEEEGDDPQQGVV